MSEAAAILMYHRIARLEPDAHGLCVSPEVFRAQLELLRERYRVLPLEELAEAAAGGRLPRGAVAITFDDGTLDSFTASELLCELGLPATFFINTARLDEEHESWWDTLERLFLEPGALPAALSVTLPAGPARFSTGSEAQRRAAHDAVRAPLLRMDAAPRDALLDELVAWSGRRFPPRTSHRALLTDELVRLGRRPGHALGAHTVHHLFLPSQPPATQRREIADSQAALEALTGRPVRSFAYPFGAVDEPTLEIVRACRFAAAVTVEERAVVAGDDRLLLPRVVAPRDLPELQRRLSTHLGS